MSARIYRLVGSAVPTYSDPSFAADVPQIEIAELEDWTMGALNHGSVRRASWIPPLVRVNRLVVTALAIGLMAGTAACSDDDTATGPGGGPVTGAFPMRTARGMAVPHTFTDSKGSKLTVEGGSLTIGAGATYALNYKGKLNALTFDLTDEGTVSVSGTTAVFTPDDGDPPYSGKIQGTSITVNFKIAGAAFDLGFKSN